jgi:3-oxoacyl-[acyl-carrier-protein] synthase II
MITIAGTGALASVGDTTDAVFDALVAGRTGRAELRGFPREDFRAGYAYEIDDRAGPRPKRPGERGEAPGRGGRPAGPSDAPGRATAWLLTVVAAALRDAGLAALPADTPIIIGTGLGELRGVELWHAGAGAAEDLHFEAALRRAFGATASYTVTNACSASLYALAMAEDLLRLGEHELAVVAGVDSITASMFGLLDRVQMETPAALAPFEGTHKGVLMGEGAAAVVLRGRPPGDSGGRPVLRSVALGCDAFHPTAPDAKGIELTMREALSRAGLTPADIDVVYAHGTGTALNDEAEGRALASVFLTVPPGPTITAIKSMTGHTSGGSGLLSLVMAVESLRTGRVPAVRGLTDPIEEVTGLRFAGGPGGGETRLADPPRGGRSVRRAQIDAFGFGGVNAVAVLELEAAPDPDGLPAGDLAEPAGPEETEG